MTNQALIFDHVKEVSLSKNYLSNFGFFLNRSSEFMLVTAESSTGDSIDIIPVPPGQVLPIRISKLISIKKQGEYTGPAAGLIVWDSSDPLASAQVAQEYARKNPIKPEVAGHDQMADDYYATSPSTKKG